MTKINTKHIQIFIGLWLLGLNPIHLFSQKTITKNNIQLYYNSFQTDSLLNQNQIYQLSFNHQLKGDLPISMNGNLTTQQLPFQPSPNRISVTFDAKTFQQNLLEKAQKKFDTKKTAQEIEKRQQCLQYRQYDQLLRDLTNDTLNAQMAKVQKYENWLDQYDEERLQQEIDALKTGNWNGIQQMPIVDSIVNQRLINTLVEKTILSKYADSTAYAVEIQEILRTDSKSLKRQRIRQLQQKIQRKVRPKMEEQLDSLKAYDYSTLSPRVDSLQQRLQNLEQLEKTLDCYQLQDYTCLFSLLPADTLEHHFQQINHCKSLKQSPLQAALKIKKQNDSLLEQTLTLDSLENRLAEAQKLRQQLPYLKAKQKEWEALQDRKSRLDFLKQQAATQIDLSLLDSMNFSELDLQNPQSISNKYNKYLTISPFQQALFRMETIELGSTFPAFSPLIYRGSQLNGLNLVYRLSQKSKIQLAGGKMHQTTFGEDLTSFYQIKSQWVHGAKWMYAFNEKTEIYAGGIISSLDHAEWQRTLAFGGQFTPIKRVALEVDMSAPSLSFQEDKLAYELKGGLELIASKMELLIERKKVGKDYQHLGNFAYQFGYDQNGIILNYKPLSFLDWTSSYQIDNALSDNNQSIRQYTNRIKLQFKKLPSLEVEYGQYFLNNQEEEVVTETGRNNLLIINLQYQKTWKILTSATGLQFNRSVQRVFTGDIAGVDNWNFYQQVNFSQYLQVGLNLQQSRFSFDEKIESLNTYDVTISSSYKNGLLISTRGGYYFGNEEKGWRGGMNAFIPLKYGIQVNGFFNYDWFYNAPFGPEPKPTINIGVGLNYFW